MIEKVIRARQILQDEGPRSLLGETRDFARDRMIPFELEVWIRHRNNEFRYGPNGSVESPPSNCIDVIRKYVLRHSNRII